MFINLMEGETITTNNLISSIKRLNSDGKEHGTIKALLKNFILPEPEMAIKTNPNDNKYVYTIPVKPSGNERAKSIHEAKQAFLNSTVSPNTTKPTNILKRDSALHYAQIATITTDDDTRSTGGGKDTNPASNIIKSKMATLPVNMSPIKKRTEPQPRKVSFKIKNASNSYRRPPLATKTVTITSTKVAELTKKFNNLVNESQHATAKQTKLVKTIEELQTSSRCSANSTSSSTVSSSPNIKIVLRQRRGSKKRNSRTRCSSMDSIDKLTVPDSSLTKIRVIRSKSDGINRVPKSPKKRLKYVDSSEQQSGSDSVDGTPSKIGNSEPTKDKTHQSSNVRNVIKKFECEITAQTTSNNTLKRHPENKKSTIIVKEKPKVPEKKSTLILTKNVVVKDGVPKIKCIKPPEIPPKPIGSKEYKEKVDLPRKKEPIYDRKKYKTNYIHTEKLPLKAVEIIQEDVNEYAATVSAPDAVDQRMNSSIVTTESSEKPVTAKKVYQEMESNITPNESFLWRRKSTTQIYSDSEKSISDSNYSFVIITANDTTIASSVDPTEISVSDESLTLEELSEPQVSVVGSESKNDSNSDFESNLVEAYNQEILRGFTSRPKKETVVEDDYEPLEPRDDDNVLVIPIKSVDRTSISSKLNCPLPEIPKQSPPESPQSNKDNIYQCLLEMRSHPEGDESSLHNYELCDNQLEERTRGDGDSDDGYEYCKSPIKPYCLTSSLGIQIAEDYKPDDKDNIKNYAITKSVSGASTVSYEKIGSDRIYEKIPARSPKSKDTSPNYSNRHSFVSSDYNGYNDNENIYDTIKHADATSLSHCYESIPNSPSMVKLRNNLRKQLTSAAQKRLSFDTVSNISQSTLSSEQKTNSIYGQRSVISYNGQEIAFQVPSSEVSASGSDRSDDWVDVSDEEKNEEQKIIM